MVSADDDMRPDALIETSPESLSADEICRGKLIKSNQEGGYIHKSFDLLTAFNNANLQEFAQKISYIVSLQTGGKLSSEVAYERIEALWKQLELSKKELGISVELNQHSGGL